MAVAAVTSVGKGFSGDIRPGVPLREHGTGPVAQENDISQERPYVNFIKRAVLSVVSLPTKGINWAAGILGGKVLYDFVYQKALKKPLSATVGKFWTHEWSIGGEQLSLRELAARLEERILGFRTGAIAEQQIKDAMVGGMRWALMLDIIPSLFSQLPFLQKAALSPYKIYRILRSSNMLLSTMPEFTSALDDVKTVLTELGPKLIKGEALSDEEKLLARNVLTMLVSGPLFYFAEMGWSEHMSSDILRRINLVLMSDIGLFAFVGEAQKAIAQLPEGQRKESATFQFLEAVEKGITFAFAGSSGAGLYQIAKSVVINDKMDSALVEGGDDIRAGAMPETSKIMEGDLISSHMFGTTLAGKGLNTPPTGPKALYSPISYTNKDSKDIISTDNPALGVSNKEVVNGVYVKDKSVENVDGQDVLHLAVNDSHSTAVLADRVIDHLMAKYSIDGSKLDPQSVRALEKYFGEISKEILGDLRSTNKDFVSIKVDDLIKGAFEDTVIIRETDHSSLDDAIKSFKANPSSGSQLYIFQYKQGANLKVTVGDYNKILALFSHLNQLGSNDISEVQVESINSNYDKMPSSDKETFIKSILTTTVNSPEQTKPAVEPPPTQGKQIFSYSDKDTGSRTTIFSVDKDIFLKSTLINKPFLSVASDAIYAYLEDIVLQNAVAPGTVAIPSKLDIQQALYVSLLDKGAFLVNKDKSQTIGMQDFSSLHNGDVIELPLKDIQVRYIDSEGNLKIVKLIELIQNPTKALGFTPNGTVVAQNATNYHKTTLPLFNKHIADLGGNTKAQVFIKNVEGNISYDGQRITFREKDISSPIYREILLVSAFEAIKKDPSLLKDYINGQNFGSWISDRKLFGLNKTQARDLQDFLVQKGKLNSTLINGFYGEHGLLSLVEYMDKFGLLQQADSRDFPAVTKLLGWKNVIDAKMATLGDIVVVKFRLSDGREVVLSFKGANLASDLGRKEVNGQLFVILDDVMKDISPSLSSYNYARAVLRSNNSDDIQYFLQHEINSTTALGLKDLSNIKIINSIWDYKDDAAFVTMVNGNSGETMTFKFGLGKNNGQITVAKLNTVLLINSSRTGDILNTPVSTYVHSPVMEGSFSDVNTRQTLMTSLMLNRGINPEVFGHVVFIEDNQHIYVEQMGSGAQTLLYLDSAWLRESSNRNTWIAMIEEMNKRKLTVSEIVKILTHGQQQQTGASSLMNNTSKLEASSVMSSLLKEIGFPNNLQQGSLIAKPDGLYISDKGKELPIYIQNHKLIALVPAKMSMHINYASLEQIKQQFPAVNQLAVIPLKDGSIWAVVDKSVQGETRLLEAEDGVKYGGGHMNGANNSNITVKETLGSSGYDLPGFVALNSLSAFDVVNSPKLLTSRGVVPFGKKFNDLPFASKFFPIHHVGGKTFVSIFDGSYALLDRATGEIIKYNKPVTASDLQKALQLSLQNKDVSNDSLFYRASVDTSGEALIRTYTLFDAYKQLSRTLLSTNEYVHLDFYSQNGALHVFNKDGVEIDSYFLPSTFPLFARINGEWKEVLQNSEGEYFWIGQKGLVPVKKDVVFSLDQIGKIVTDSSGNPYIYKGRLVIQAKDGKLYSIDSAKLVNVLPANITRMFLGRECCKDIETSKLKVDISRLSAIYEKAIDLQTTLENLDFRFKEFLANNRTESLRFTGDYPEFHMDIIGNNGNVVKDVIFSGLVTEHNVPVWKSVNASGAEKFFVLQKDNITGEVTAHQITDVSRLHELKLKYVDSFTGLPAIATDKGVAVITPTGLFYRGLDLEQQLKLKYIQSIESIKHQDIGYGVPKFSLRDIGSWIKNAPNRIVKIIFDEISSSLAGILAKTVDKDADQIADLIAKDAKESAIDAYSTGVSNRFIEQLIAQEDHKIFTRGGGTESGYNLEFKTLAAMLASRGHRGGSTIYQLLAKTYMYDIQRLRGQGVMNSLERKSLELAVAHELSTRLTPQEATYALASRVSFGDIGGVSLKGVDMASVVFFGHDSQNLTIGESAILTSSINLPYKYGPLSFFNRGNNADPSAAISMAVGDIQKLYILGLVSRESLVEGIREISDYYDGSYPELQDLIDHISTDHTIDPSLRITIDVRTEYTKYIESLISESQALPSKGLDMSAFRNFSTVNFLDYLRAQGKLTDEQVKYIRRYVASQRRSQALLHLNTVVANGIKEKGSPFLGILDKDIFSTLDAMLILEPYDTELRGIIERVLQAQDVLEDPKIKELAQSNANFAVLINHLQTKGVITEKEAQRLGDVWHRMVGSGIMDFTDGNTIRISPYVVDVEVKPDGLDSITNSWIISKGGFYYRPGLSDSYGIQGNTVLRRVGNDITSININAKSLEIPAGYLAMKLPYAKGEFETIIVKPVEINNDYFYREADSNRIFVKGNNGLKFAGILVEDSNHNSYIIARKDLSLDPLTEKESISKQVEYIQGIDKVQDYNTLLTEKMSFSRAVDVDQLSNCKGCVLLAKSFISISDGQNAGHAQAQINPNGTYVLVDVKDVPISTKNSTTQKVFILMPVNGLDKGKIIALTQNDFERKFLIPGVGYIKVDSAKQATVKLSQSVQVFKDIVAYKLYEKYGYKAFEMYPDLYTIKEPIQDAIQNTLQQHSNLYMAVSVASKEGSYLIGTTPNQEALLPGSIMKTITAYLAVKYGIQNPNWSGDYIKLGGVPIQNWTVTSGIHNSVISSTHMTIPEVLAYSNNVGAASLMYQILYELEHEQGLTPAQAVKQIENDIKDLGILDFEGASGFNMQSDGTLASVLYAAFGQGSVRLTPEALAQFHSWLVQQAIIGDTAKDLSFMPGESISERQIDEKAADVVLKGMQMAVDNRYGTTHGIYAPLKEDLNKMLTQANSPYEVVQIYGKTATGEIGGDKLNYGASTIIQFKDKRTGDVIALVLETYLKGEDPVAAHHYNPTLELTADMIKDLVEKDPSLSWLHIEEQKESTSPSSIDEAHVMTPNSAENQSNNSSVKPVLYNPPKDLFINIAKGLPDLLGQDSDLQKIPQSRRDQCVAGAMLAPKIKFASLVKNAPELQKYLDIYNIKFDSAKTIGDLSLNPDRFIHDSAAIQNSAGVAAAGAVPFILTGVVQYGDPEGRISRPDTFRALQSYRNQRSSRYGLVATSDKYYKDIGHYEDMLKVLFSGTPILLYRPVNSLIGDYDGHVVNMSMIQDKDGRPYIALIGQNGLDQGGLQFRLIPYAGLTQEKLLKDIRDFMYPPESSLGFVPDKQVWFVYKYHDGDLQASIPDASKIPFTENMKSQGGDNEQVNGQGDGQDNNPDYVQGAPSPIPIVEVPPKGMIDNSDLRKGEVIQSLELKLPTLAEPVKAKEIDDVNTVSGFVVGSILPRADGYTAPKVPDTERIRDSHDAVFADLVSNGTSSSKSTANSGQSTSPPNTPNNINSNKSSADIDSVGTHDNNFGDKVISGLHKFASEAGEVVKEQSIQAAKKMLITITKPALEVLIDKINRNSPEVKIDYERDWNLKDRPFNVAFIVLDYEQGQDGSVNTHFTVDNKPGLFDIQIDDTRNGGDALGGLPYKKPLVGHADFTGMVTVGGDGGRITTINRDMQTHNGIFDTITWPWANKGKIGLQQMRDLLASKAGQRPDVVFIFSYQGLRDLTKNIFIPWEHELDNGGKMMIHLDKENFPETRKYLEAIRTEILSQYPNASEQQKQALEKEFNSLFTENFALDQFIFYLRSFRRHGLGAMTTRREGLAKALVKDLLEYYLKHPAELYKVIKDITNDDSHNNFLNEESDIQIYSFKEGKAVPRVITLPDLGELFSALIDYLGQ